jgi:2-C-methyl-D-erythritol 4-phosphate cytidylyltransferase
LAVALIVAAGRGERLGAGRPKALAELAGRPLVQWCVDALRAVEAIERIVIALPPGMVVDRGAGAPRDTVEGGAGAPRDTVGRGTGAPRDTVGRGPGTPRDTLEEIGMVGGLWTEICALEGVLGVEGGAVRSESVRLALAAAGPGDPVLVHDAARPLLTPQLVERVLAAVEQEGVDAAIAAAPVTDTVKRVGPHGQGATGDYAKRGGEANDERRAEGKGEAKANGEGRAEGEGEAKANGEGRAEGEGEAEANGVGEGAAVLGALSAGVVRETLDRAELWAVQTPQVFRRAALEDALDVPPEVLARATDDAWLIERAGGTVVVVQAPRENLKVTTPLDLALAELLLARE